MVHFVVGYITLNFRGANGTQQEHMDIAHACAEVIAQNFSTKYY